MRLPGLPVDIHQLAHARSRAEADEMIAVPGRIHDALRVIRRIPQRRVRLLQGLQLHRDVVILVVLALESQPCVRQPGHEDGQRLVEDGARLSSIDPEVAQLIGRDPAPDAEIQASAREVVQHADFLDEPQGVVEGQQVDERPQTDAPGALRRRGEEQRRGWRHAEGRGVVLGEVIAGEAGGIRGLQELQPLLVELMQGRLAAINPIEQAKSHLSHLCLLCMHAVVTTIGLAGHGSNPKLNRMWRRTVRRSATIASRAMLGQPRLDKNQRTSEHANDAVMIEGSRHAGI